MTVLRRGFYCNPPIRLQLRWKSFCFVPAAIYLNQPHFRVCIQVYTYLSISDFVSACFILPCMGRFWTEVYMHARVLNWMNVNGVRAVVILHLARSIAFMNVLF